jgi:isopentenyldiphosphate isomerase
MHTSMGAGVKRAAVRKLEHELGIPASQVPLEGFKFMTRLHYWAADTVTHGPESEWGEHEIDYVMLIKGASGRPGSVWQAWWGRGNFSIAFQ